MDVESRLPDAPVAPMDLDTDELHLSEEQEEILQMVLEGQSIFFTGSAGTGKSACLRYIIQQLKTRDPSGVAVTAPTGRYLLSS